MDYTEYFPLMRAESHPHRGHRPVFLYDLIAGERARRSFRP